MLMMSLKCEEWRLVKESVGLWEEGGESDGAGRLPSDREDV